MIAPANAGLISMRVNSQNHPQKDTMIFSKQNAIGTSPTVHIMIHLNGHFRRGLLHVGVS